MSDHMMPEWDLADRMRKALRQAGLSVQEMADYLGVSRNSIGNWINSRVQPSTQTLRLWAMKTGVPYQWLCEGDRAAAAGGLRTPGSQTMTRWAA
jgi:transcriptional regulator with XRE-family HTH domain